MLRRLLRPFPNMLPHRRCSRTTIHDLELFGGQAGHTELTNTRRVVVPSQVCDEERALSNPHRLLCKIVLHERAPTDIEAVVDGV